MIQSVPVNEPVIGKREKELVLECLETGWISSEGPFVNKFEQDFSKRVKRKHGIACSNGTCALELAIKALGIGEGDEVILPSFTIISCAAAIVRAGAVPIVVDCDLRHWNMNPDEILNSITSRTAAIMIVHIYGLPVDIDPILKIAEKFKLFVIEDSAEIIGGKYKNQPCGSFGDISTFSFYPNKHITTGEGGMVVTNDSDIASRCRSLRNLCFQPNKRFVHEELGWNYRMTNIQAALGIAQLEKLDESLEKKIWIGKKYLEFLKEVKTIQLPVEELSYAKNIFWVFGLVIKNDLHNTKNIINNLRKMGIGTRPFFHPIHKQPVFIKKGLFKNVKKPNSELIGLNGFYIPSGLKINLEQIEYVANTLKEMLKNKD
tara:strand:- start:13076 stop:14200 length:1125 start_codon:yes stop_codon:yes gene_type:complete